MVDIRTILANGTVISPIRTVKESSVIIEDGVITSVIPNHQVQSGRRDRVIDVQGKFIAPGFIDIHTHGAGGHDFMDGTVEAIVEAANTHLRYGTTTIVPTTLASDLVELLDSLKKFTQAKARLKDGPNLHGLHLEGPYFSREQAGAQDPRYIRNPDPAEYGMIVERSSDIKRWTIAPELPGALEMARYLSERGILCSMGHTNAVYEEVVAAVENGFRHVTHLYSAMSGVRRISAFRCAGVIEAALLLDELTVEVIADGVHLPKSLLQLIYKVKGPDRICLVTDSMRGAGMPEGESILGSLRDGQRVIIEDGVAKLPDRSAFAGSVATADRLVRTMIKLAEVPLIEAVKMATLTPARVLGLERSKGLIAPGKDADVVVFSADIDVSLVMVGGEIRFSKDQTVA